MKKSVSFSTFIVFVAGLCLLFTFCSVSVAKEKVIKLKFGSNSTPASVRVAPWSDWGKEIEKRTDGGVTIKLYLSGSLFKTRDTHQALKNGITDIAVWQPSLGASDFPLNLVMDLPFMGFPNNEVATSIWMEIIEKFPEVKAEFDDIKLLWVNSAYPHTISTSKKEIRTPSDLKGVKLGVFGMNVKIAETLGAVPIAAMPPEMYMSLEKGVYDGTIIPFGPMRSLRFLELLPYHTTTVINNMGVFGMMNLKTWNSLPPDIQKIFDELGPFIQKKEAAALDGDEENTMKMAKDLGHTFTKNTPEEVAEWQRLVKPTHEKWIADTEAKGLPARAVYDEVKRLAKKYSQ